MVIIDYITKINISTSALANAVIQAVIFELIMILIIPLIGTIINDVVVRGIRKLFSAILGFKIEYFIANYLMCIGVVIHELSHAFFAAITGAEIVEISLFKPQGNELGHVGFRTRGPAGLRALQEGLSACAPVVVGILICSQCYTMLFPILNQTWQWVVCIYVLVSIVFHMDMSKPDRKLYFKGVGLLALIALPFTFAYFGFFR